MPRATAEGFRIDLDLDHARREAERVRGMLVNGHFVNATEWWDPHWIEDRVTRKLASRVQWWRGRRDPREWVISPGGALGWG